MFANWKIVRRLLVSIESVGTLYAGRNLEVIEVVKVLKAVKVL